MKKQYKNLVAAMALSTIGISSFAATNNGGNGNNQDLLATKDAPEIIVENCKHVVGGISDEVLKEKEKTKCIFIIDQQFKTEQLNSLLRTIKQDKESILAFNMEGVKTTNILLKTVENLRKAMILPEGKTQEFERVAVLYKDPAIDLKEKEKQADAYYKTYGENNYKTTKDVYNSFKTLNEKLIKQKEVVINVEKYLMTGLEEKEINKSIANLNKSFDKEIKINNEILKSYDNFIMARKLDAQDALNKVVEEKKIKLSKKECQLLDTMYSRYEIKSFKNLTCK